MSFLFSDGKIAKDFDELPRVGVRERKKSKPAPNHYMEFEFTAEQIQLRKSIRDFAEAEICPTFWSGMRARPFRLR